MSSILPSVIVLGLAALAASALTSSRRSPPELADERRAARTALTLATVVQAAHFFEEAATGFPVRLGAVFGLPAMSFGGFVVFNLLWLAVWVWTIGALPAGRRFAFFAAWFLAIAGMANGVLHPALALTEGAYFPGLATAPVEGIACLWLWARLRGATAQSAAGA